MILQGSADGRDQRGAGRWASQCAAVSADVDPDTGPRVVVVAGGVPQTGRELGLRRPGVVPRPGGDLRGPGRQVQGGVPQLPGPRAGRVVDGRLGPGPTSVEGDVDAGDGPALRGEGVADDVGGPGGLATAVVGTEDP